MHTTHHPYECRHLAPPLHSLCSARLRHAQDILQRVSRFSCVTPSTRVSENIAQALANTTSNARTMSATVIFRCAPTSIIEYPGFSTAVVQLYFNRGLCKIDAVLKSRDNRMLPRGP